MKKNVLLLLLATVAATHPAVAATPFKLTVHAGTPGPQISPTM